MWTRLRHRRWCCATALTLVLAAGWWLVASAATTPFFTQRDYDRVEIGMTEARALAVLRQPAVADDGRPLRPLIIAEKTEEEKALEGDPDVTGVYHVKLASEATITIVRKGTLLTAPAQVTLVIKAGLVVRKEWADEAWLPHVCAQLRQRVGY